MGHPVLSLRTKLRTWREDRLDRKIGGISLAEVRESRFQDLGAYPTMSAEYGAIDMMFRHFPLSEKDVFVDVGCGFGRVISRLLLKKSPCKKYYGVELDPDVAAITAKTSAGSRFATRTFLPHTRFSPTQKISTDPTRDR